MPTTAILPSGEQVSLPAFSTTAEVLASVQSAVQALNSLITNFNPGGVVETYLEGVALAIGNDASTYPGTTAQGAYEALASVQNAAFALTAQGLSLDLKAADVGVARKPATKAQGPYQFSIISPSQTTTLIPAGSLVSADAADPTAPPTIYATDSDATIAPGAAQSNIVSVTCITAGRSGNALPGAANRIVSGASNVTGTNPQSIAGGADVEQDDFPNGGLRARTLSAIANASQCTISAIENDARKFPGVSDAVLIENTADDGTRQDGRGQLYIDDGSGDLGNTTNTNHAVIAQVQAAFDQGLYRAASTEVNVVGSVLLPITISLIAQITQQYATQVAPPATVAESIQLAVYAYVQNIGIGKPVYVSEVVRFANEVAGVLNVPVGSVQINGAVGDLVPSAVQVPRCLLLTSITVVTQIVSL